MCRPLSKIEVVDLLIEIRDKSERHDALETFDFERISAGAFKQVYSRDDIDFVVKIHNNDRYGAWEMDNALSCPAHLKPFLLPIEQYRGFQIQRKLNLRACSCEVAGCDGFVDGMEDSNSDGCGRNHTHAADGTLIIYDYGQNEQWSDGGYVNQEDDRSSYGQCNCTDCRIDRGDTMPDEEISPEESVQCSDSEIAA
jgi:hypothetical protein